MHNLDALCRRFGIDTSARTRHGALLDAQILAQVYLAMTGGQSNLFQETQNNEPQISHPSMIKKNKSNKEKIKVVFANQEETELHQNYFKN
jgi:DNA polymerase-3 subunit epsilon